VSEGSSGVPVLCDDAGLAEGSGGTGAPVGIAQVELVGYAAGITDRVPGERWGIRGCVDGDVGRCGRALSIGGIVGAQFDHSRRDFGIGESGEPHPLHSFRPREGGVIGTVVPVHRGTGILEPVSHQLVPDPLDVDVCGEVRGDEAARRSSPGQIVDEVHLICAADGVPEVDRVGCELTRGKEGGQIVGPDVLQGPRQHERLGVGAAGHVPGCQPDKDQVFSDRIVDDNGVKRGRIGAGGVGLI